MNSAPPSTKDAAAPTGRHVPPTPRNGRNDLLRDFAAIAAPLLLLAALAGYLTHGLIVDLRHTEREIRGLHSLHHLFHLTTRVEEARGLVYLVEPVRAGIEEQRHASQVEIGDALERAIADPDIRLFGLDRELAELRERFTRGDLRPATQPEGSVEAHKRFDAYTDVIFHLLVAMEVTASRSGLLEGKELDGHYLMDQIVTRLGFFSEIVGRARGVTSALMRQPSLSAEDHRALQQVATSLALGMESVAHNMGVMALVAPHLQTAFDPFHVQLTRRITLIQEQIENVDSGNPTVNAEELFVSATQIIAIVELLHHQAMIRMDMLLEGRHDALTRTLITALLGTGITAVVILLLFTFYYRSNRRSRRQRDATIHTLDVIGSAQTAFIATRDPHEAFDVLLTGLLDLTGSEFGFIGEVLHTDDGNPYLKTRAVTRIARKGETHRVRDENTPEETAFFDPETLFEAVTATGEPVIFNPPAAGVRQDGRPEGHPPLNALLGMPVHRGKDLIGMVGIANRPAGYSPGVIRELRPYLSTCAHLISAHRTERAVAESEERHRAVISTMVDAVVVISETGIIERFNPSAERMFGFAAHEAIGRNVNILMPEPFRSEHDTYLERYKRAGKTHVLGIRREVEGRRKDGSVFPLDLSINQMEVTGSRMYVGILRDITERKRMERMKSEFISTVSHELRTPLTSIRGALGLLGGSTAGELPAKAGELLSIAHNNTERLLLLINDILDIDKIESGNMPFHFVKTRLAPFLDEAVKAHEGYARQHDITLKITGVDDSLAIHADPDRLMQVLANLLSNAAKFSPAGEVVEISAERRGSKACICVTDHGPGIPEEFQARVFEKFTQSDATNTRRAGGTGLGLSIARAIVEKHGGTIGFTSRLGEGTTFHVDLPAAGAPPGSPVDQQATVLVVENDAEVARIIRRILATEDVLCDIVTTGEDGLKMLEGKSYRAIILNLRLPGMSGTEFLHTMRNRSATRRVPVVVVSAQAGPTREELEGGAVDIFDWLEKPIDETRLLLAVREAARSGSRRVLHVEDEADTRRVVRMLLEGKAEITEAATLKAAREALAGGGFDLILLDQGLPDGRGVDLLEDVQMMRRPPRVVIFSALEVTRETERQVDAVLRKATTSNAHLLDTIKRYLQPGGRKRGPAPCPN